MRRPAAPCSPVRNDGQKADSVPKGGVKGKPAPAADTRSRRRRAIFQTNGNHHRTGGDPIRENLTQFCRRTHRAGLLEQWHPTKNGTLTPEQVPPGSHRRVWWICQKGHEWQAIVKSRAAGCGCPVCTNRSVQPGDNDLATTHPHLARQWHAIKNAPLTPWAVTAGAHRKVWWRCDRGHEWQAAIFSRTVNTTGCPVCAGRAVQSGENDLQTLFPGIAAQWHPDRNGTRTPDTISPCSNRKVWWVCEKGHPYPAVVAARTMHGSGCPYCAGRRALPGFNDLTSAAPNVAAQWHPTLNGSLTPEMITAGSRKKVWWLCPEGHVWQAAVYSRTGKQKSGCPVCAGRVKAARPYRSPSARSAGPVQRGAGHDGHAARSMKI